jgi:uncharacterized protein
MYKFFISYFFLLGVSTALSATVTISIPPATPSLLGICRVFFEKLGWLSSLDPSDFVSRVNQVNTEIWTKEFQKIGRKYRAPRVVIFKKKVQLPGGQITTGDYGPFYVPDDETVYLPTEFWSRLKNKYGGDTEAARAYVIAHETAHHVQYQLGYGKKYDDAGVKTPSAMTQIERQRELHADYLTGVWARSLHGPDKLLENRDIADIVRLVNNLGADALAKLTEVPFFEEKVDHPTSTKRKQAFAAGFKGNTDFERSVIPAGMPTFEEMIASP